MKIDTVAQAIRIDFEDARGVAEISLTDALKRSITNAKPATHQDRQRWAIVKDLTSHGSNVSIALCKWAGVNPDEYLYGPDCGHSSCEYCHVLLCQHGITRTACDECSAAELRAMAGTA